MGSLSGEKPHAVCIPFPAQGHINPMLKLAKLLHSNGFHITFVNTEYNHRRLLRTHGTSSLDGLYDFCFETIPDGLPPSDEGTTQDISLLFQSTMTKCLVPFRQLLTRLNGEPSRVPPVTCIVSDGGMSFTLDVAKELLIPEVLFWTTSACGFMAYMHYHHLIQKGLVPLKDMEDVNNGYLETVIDWIPGMKNTRLRDIPTFIRTTNSDDTAINFILHEIQRASMASAIILNTFNELEHPVLEAMASLLPPVYTIGPLSLLSSQIPESPVASIGSNLWKEEPGCIEWLEGKKPKSVVYVNFGSVTVMSKEQLIEFAWGLANGKHNFLWIIRPDLVIGDAAVVPQEFMKETQERGLLASWCSQEEVLKHPSIGGFLTHCGWNSTLESVCGGVPVICWPFFAEQQTNCRYLCTEWGIGMEIDNNVKREEVEGLIKELMNGDKGMEMRNKALEWKEQAENAARDGGSSFNNLKRLLSEVLLAKISS
ncbi:putative 7-deoxyloganetin glucosyltransferase [Dioscorea sansibarensis]